MHTGLLQYAKSTTAALVKVYYFLLDDAESGPADSVLLSLGACDISEYLLEASDC